MNSNLQNLIKTCCALGSAETMMSLGISAGEVSQRQARTIYGKWFSDADKAGRIRPCRIDEGKNGTRHYRVTDILALKVQDYAKCELIWK